ncbi:MAG: hypothetical protein HY680_02315, partial [Chloroflexi bacterium]|nr:hypothetical protein [Chloroflexota bacterium]
MRVGVLSPGKLHSGLSSRAAQWRAGFGLYGYRGWTVAAVAAALALVVVGILSAMIENPLFGRQTAVRVQDNVIWITTGLLMGLVGGSFVVKGAG